MQGPFDAEPFDSEPSEVPCPEAEAWPDEGEIQSALREELGCNDLYDLNALARAKGLVT